MPIKTLTENFSFRYTKQEKRDHKKLAKDENMRPGEYIRFLIQEAKKRVAASD